MMSAEAAPPTYDNSNVSEKPPLPASTAGFQPAPFPGTGPTPYSPPPVTQTTTAPTPGFTVPPPVAGSGPTSTQAMLDMEYIKSVKGILDFTGGILAFIVFLTACIGDNQSGAFTRLGGGWVQFVSMVHLILAIASCLLYGFGVIGQVPFPAKMPRPIVEIIMYSAFTVGYLISFAISAARGPLAPAVRACAAFCFFQMGVCGFAVAWLLIQQRKAKQASEGAPNMSTMPPPIKTDLEAPKY